MGSTPRSTSNEKLNMATRLRCFDILGQSVPWKSPSSKNGIGRSEVCCPIAIMIKSYIDFSI